MRFVSPIRALLQAASVLLLALPGPAVFPGSPVPAVGEEVLRDLAERGEARVIISLRPSVTHAAVDPRPLEGRRRMDEVLESLPEGTWGEARRLNAVPAAAVRITGKALSGLLSDSRVSRIDRDEKVFGTQTDPLSQIGADRVQALGFSGQGITVAVLDSGTDPLSNVDLDASLDSEECFCSYGGGCCPDGSSRQSGPGSAASVTSHGTGVIGIVTSDGIVAPMGVAPGSRVVAVRVLDDGLIGTYSDILEALDWVVENRKDVRLVNLSIAGGPFPPDCDHFNAFNEAVAQLSAILRDRGGLIIASAGNHYSLTLMGSPACVSSVVSVGAVDAADVVMPFSDAGPSLDLLAPGDHIPAAGSYGRIVTLTGTSAAAPHVTGAAALVLSAAPGLSAQELEDRLEGKGVPVVDARNGATYPRVDAFRALVIPVEVDSHPAVHSPRSPGHGLSVRVEPPSPFLAADLDPASLTLSAAGGLPVPAEIGEARLGDGDQDGILDLTVHFNRQQVMSGLFVPGTVSLTLEGSFFSGLDCRGRTSLLVLSTGNRVRAEGTGALRAAP